jgi:phage FluMu protein Com
MPTIACPNCASELRAPENAVGKKVRCPKCKTVVPVPAVDEAPRVVQWSQQQAAPPPLPPAPDELEEVVAGLNHDAEQGDPYPMVPVRYRSLRVMMTLLRVAGVLYFIGAGICLLVGFLTLITFAFVPALASAGLACFASAALMQVFVDTEENTREQQLLLSQLVRTSKRP